MSRTALAGLLLCVLAMAGCTTLFQLNELRDDLDSAGYDTAVINHDTTNGHDVLTVEVATGMRADDDADRIAELVWTTYPAEVDQLVITVNGQPAMDATSDELAARFGERPAGLGVREDGDGGVPVTAIVVVSVVGVLLAGMVVLVWWRGRRPPPPVTGPPGDPRLPNPYQYRPPYPPGP